MWSALFLISPNSSRKTAPSGSLPGAIRAETPIQAETPGTVTRDYFAKLIEYPNLKRHTRS
ncbi:Cytokinin dehydrogenase [Psidium guajava]|nr:Cytokinin dehydrogenase [Psidium guajava]